MAKINTTSSTARIDAILRHYYKFSMKFAVDASGRFVFQVPDEIILFEYGVDDTSGDFNNAGYTDNVGLNDNVEITSALKGGAFSSENACLLLSVGFVPETGPRIGLTDAGAADPNFTATPGNGAGGLCPRRAGRYGDTERNMIDQLTYAAWKGSQLALLPAGTNSGCSIYLGIPQLTAPGTGLHNSDLPSYGFDAPEVRFTFGDDLIVFPSRQQQDYKPNRIQIEWPTAVPSGSSAELVELIDGGDARASGTVVSMDLICVVDFARVVLLDRSNQPLNAGGDLKDDQIAGFQPLTDLDREKIARFRNCF